MESEENRSSSQHVLERLLQYACDEDDERWILLDTDHYTNGPHAKNFTNTLKESREKGVNVALSKPCFEFWLLLHHTDDANVMLLNNANETERALRKALGSYNKVRLNKEDYPDAAVKKVCLRAKYIDSKVTGGNIPSENTSRVYLLLMSIIQSSIPYQLPGELRELLSILRQPHT